MWVPSKRRKPLTVPYLADMNLCQFSTKRVAVAGIVWLFFAGVLDSNLGRGMACTERGLSWLSLVAPSKGQHLRFVTAASFQILSVLSFTYHYACMKQDNAL